jgi:hypothetical protein
MTSVSDLLESQNLPLQSNGQKVYAYSQRQRPTLVCSRLLVLRHRHVTNVVSTLPIPLPRILPWEMITIHPTRRAQGSRAMHTALSSTTCTHTSAGTPPSSTRCSYPSPTSIHWHLLLRCPFSHCSSKPRKPFVSQSLSTSLSSLRLQLGLPRFPRFHPHQQVTLCCKRLQGRELWLSCLPPRRLPLF